MCVQVQRNARARTHLEINAAVVALVQTSIVVYTPGARRARQGLLAWRGGAARRRGELLDRSAPP
jgi:hypothetical protein